jgi:hypothetical protein
MYNEPSASVTTMLFPSYDVNILFVVKLMKFGESVMIINIINNMSIKNIGIFNFNFLS